MKYSVLWALKLASLAVISTSRFEDQFWNLALLTSPLSWGALFSECSEHFAPPGEKRNPWLFGLLNVSVKYSTKVSVIAAVIGLFLGRCPECLSVIG